MSRRLHDPTRIDQQEGRRRQELGVHSLDHFALTVPDLDAAGDFFQTFGLRVSSEPNGLGVRPHQDTSNRGLLIEGPRKRLHHLSFGIFADDLPAFERRLEELKVPLLDPPPGFSGNGLWIRDPDGTWIELRIAPKSSPDQKTTGRFASSPAGVAGAPKRSRVRPVQPLRLAHCLLFTRDVTAAVSFFQRALGLRLSDRSGDEIAFMHAIHGSDHHLIAFARADGPGLHHSSWTLGSIDEVGLGAMQMAAKGFPAGWGMGRHVLGSNYFHYVRDPWGSYAEYTCDMDYIPADCDWRPRNYEAEDAFYVWGPSPPSDWTCNHELDSVSC